MRKLDPEWGPAIMVAGSFTPLRGSLPNKVQLEGVCLQVNSPVSICYCLSFQIYRPNCSSSRIH